jgi:twitching motility protein PilT
MLNELMGSNLRTREAVALGEDEGRSFYEIIEANATFGWTTFDQSLHRAFQANLITEETANLYATNKGRMTRYIDDVKKKRGLDSEASTGLKLDLEAAMPNSYINMKIGR